MLTSRISKLLNKKANEDYFRSNNYLQLSAIANTKGLNGTEAFLANQSTKALDSCNRILNYLTECGEYPEISKVESGLTDFENIEQVFLVIHESEKSCLADLNNILDASLSEKDYNTFSFLQSFANNQHEQEFIIKSLLDKISLIGHSGKALYLIDKDISSIAPAIEDPNI